MRPGGPIIALSALMLAGCIPPAVPPSGARQPDPPVSSTTAVTEETVEEPYLVPRYEDVLDQPAVWEMRPVTASPEAAAHGIHVVSTGETGIAIARAYGVRWSDLVSLNGLEEPFILKVGQPLKLPAANSPIASPVSPAAPNMDPVEARAAAFKLNLDDILTGGEPAGEVANSGPVASAPKPVPTRVAEPQHFTSGFGWPVAGRVVARFGPAGEGIVHQGIEIRTAAAAPVKASGDGVVAFVGDDVVGYGGMILIRHGAGWITAYGRVARASVSRGQIVKRGDIIGHTGSGTAPQLHFQLRKQRTPVDPLKHLPARA